MKRTLFKPSLAKALVVVLAMQAATGARAQEVTVVVDGSPVLTDSPQPTVIGGVLLVPSTVLERMGITRRWNPREHTVVLTKGGRKVSMRVGAIEAQLEGMTMDMEQAPLLRRRGILFPIRFVAECFGARVHWDETVSSLDITTIGWTEPENDARIGLFWREQDDDLG